MIDEEELRLQINQAELHLRNARGELNEIGRILDMLRGGRVLT